MRRATTSALCVALIGFSVFLGGCGSGDSPVGLEGESTKTVQQTLETSSVGDSSAPVAAVLEEMPKGAKGPASSFLQQEAKLVPMDGAAGDRFGAWTAISGDRVIVGADYDDDKGTDSGAAYIFRNVAGVWIQEVKLVPSDGIAGAHFGQSVAIDMTTRTAVVGAYLDDPTGLADAGSAYVYVFDDVVDNWVPEAKLVAVDASSGDRNGLSVAISGNTVLTGAYWDDVNAAQSGSAYVFVRNGMTWTQEAKLSASDGQASDDFGVRLAIDGDRAVIAAHVDDDNGTDSGSVYAFARNAGVWVPQGKIKPADGQAGDQFGVSLSMRGLTFIAGAYGDDDMGTDAGAAYVFRNVMGTWTQDAKIYGTDTAAGDGFGFSVGLGTNKAIVGAFNDDTPVGANAGSVYVFRKGMLTWDQEGIMQSTDAATGDVLGYGVGFEPTDNTFVAGAWGDDDLGANSGSAYIFSFGKALGVACSADVECASAFCVDGVCCQSACGGGSDSDCQVCSVAKGSPSNGYCSAAPNTYICRSAVSSCDLNEKCDGMAMTCPIDKWAPPGTLCRAASGTCDVAEVCTGMSNQCPADAVVALNAKVCRSSAGVCDPTEKCDGVSKACPSNKYFPAGTICRLPAGPCDATEYCNGSMAQCPGDQMIAANTVCRNAAGACDAPEKCDGFTSTCPADVKKGAGTICRNAVGSCDVTERCDGTTSQCPADAYLALGTVCRGLAGTCDVVETCSGTSGVCPANAVAAAGVVCRSAAGTCDLAESCNGTSATCPADQYKGASAICRPSMNTTCDPYESCTGTSATCPNNAFAPNGTMCGSGMICTTGACVPLAVDPEPASLIEKGLDDGDPKGRRSANQNAIASANGRDDNEVDNVASSACTLAGSVGSSPTKYGFAHASLLALLGIAAMRRRRHGSMHLIQRISVASGLAMGALLSTGCELIAGIDRGQIDPTGGISTGGKGGDTGQAGMGGKGGEAGQGGGGQGGMGGQGGGQGGEAGMGGQGGGPIGCAIIEDCPSPSSACEQAACTNNVCTYASLPAQTPIASQTLGDCKVVVCNGAGQTMSQNDDNDIIDSGAECAIDICEAGARKTMAVGFGAPCNQNGGALCDGNGACVPGVCGDAAITGNEVCDDGNVDDGDGCDSNCTPTGCGNGITTAGEQCDDGNMVETDTCISTCKLYGCGDGVVEPAESCDDGNPIEGDGCDSNCTSSACGNGARSLDEPCDDGNTMDGDGCSAICLVETDYQCTIDTVPNTCSLAETDCADGIDNDNDGVADTNDADCALANDVPPCNAGETLFVLRSVDIPKNIPDEQGVLSRIFSSHAGLIKRAVVTLSITHSGDDELDIALISPFGTRVVLSMDQGAGGANYVNTLFDDACMTPINNGMAPFTGCYAPQDPLLLLSDEPSNGEWNLEVGDDTLGKTGSVQAWSLALCVGALP